MLTRIANRQSTRWMLADLVTLLLVVTAYLPALHGGFIWDDDVHLTNNPHIVGTLGFHGIWTSSAATYYPLVLTSFWLQHALWGLAPLPYHAVNIIVHALCAICLCRVLLSLKLQPFAAWLGSVLWALHPVQVESAAWITELKNTQSGLFYLLAVLAFIKWRERPASEVKFGTYLVFLLCAILALVSKTSTVMLPAVLVLCAWWLDGKWNWKTLIGLSPLFLLSGAAAAWTIWEQKFHSGALGDDWRQGMLERIAVSGNTVWFYLGKLLWPHPLIFLYPRWTVDVRNVLAYLPALAVLATLAILWWFRDRWSRAWIFVFAYFLVSLFPVLDFFNVYFFRYSFVADHFQYLASMGPLAFAAVGIRRAIQLRWPQNNWLLPAISGALIIVLMTLTAQHAPVFHDNETLWLDTIDKNGGAWLAHNNLATIYMDRDRLRDAIAELEVTLEIQPHYIEGHANLGNALFESGRVDEAIAQFRLALEQGPEYGRVHDYLGIALMTQGMMDEAAAEVGKALEIDPHDTTARENLGIVYAANKDIARALPQFEEAVREKPGDINYRMRLGKALLLQNQYPDAVAQFSEVLRLDPNNVEARKELEEIGTAAKHQ